MRKSEIEKKLKELNEFISNVSSVQRQLLEKLGYEYHWQYQQCCGKYIPVVEKIKSAEEDPPESKTVKAFNIEKLYGDFLLQEDRHWLFELILGIDNNIDIADQRVQNIFYQIEKIWQKRIA